MAYGPATTGQINTYQQATNAVPAPREHTLLERVNQGLASHADELQNVAHRLHRLADRVMGTRPEGVEKVAAIPPDSSIMQAFARNTDSMSSALSILREAAERLEAL